MNNDFERFSNTGPSTEYRITYGCGSTQTFPTRTDPPGECPHCGEPVVESEGM